MSIRTVFQRPQADLVPDAEGARKYANVDNVMEVTRGGSSYHVPVAVPTMLFTFMKEVASIPPETAVTLSIDKDGERYIFSLFDGEKIYDLWDYSQKSLPQWILNRAYAIRPS